MARNTVNNIEQEKKKINQYFRNYGAAIVETVKLKRETFRIDDRPESHIAVQPRFGGVYL